MKCYSKIRKTLLNLVVCFLWSVSVPSNISIFDVVILNGTSSRFSHWEFFQFFFAVIVKFRCSICFFISYHNGSNILRSGLCAASLPTGEHFRTQKKNLLHVMRDKEESRPAENCLHLCSLAEN